MIRPRNEYIAVRPEPLPEKRGLIHIPEAAFDRRIQKFTNPIA